MAKAEMVRRTKVLRWVKEQAKITEMLLKTVPDSETARARVDMLNDICKEFNIENDEIQI